MEINIIMKFGVASLEIFKKLKKSKKNQKNQQKKIKLYKIQ
jgi:hypothetical protein